MFECAEQLLIQLSTLLPTLIALYICFDITGGILFGKR